MGGFFGVVSETDCVADLFYGTDYHSHLGTVRGGLAIRDGRGFARHIHDITNAQFRSKFEDDVGGLHGTAGVGVISDYEDQPLIINSHLGVYALVTVGKVANLQALAREALAGGAHFSEMSGGALNPTELVATLINRGHSFEEGLALALRSIEGSCSVLLLTADGLYVARDRFGRTPVVLGVRDGARAAALESCAFPNLGFEVERDLGPGEIVHLTAQEAVTLRPPGERMHICAFLWVYYGYPASEYEGVNVEVARNRCGAALARREDRDVDVVAGIPDSGTGHGLGYAGAAGIPFQRPYVKYTPTWPRSFMPQEQRIRDLVARMKLIPVRAIIEGKRLLFCEDSIVRGTQLKDTIARLYRYRAREVHMRVACPPLIHACPFLNFSRSRSELDLAARKAIHELEDGPGGSLDEYADPATDRYAAMVDRVRDALGLTSLRYQILDDLVDAIGLPREKLCTHCWNAAACGLGHTRSGERT